MPRPVRCSCPLDHPAPRRSSPPWQIRSRSAVIPLDGAALTKLSGSATMSPRAGRHRVATRRFRRRPPAEGTSKSAPRRAECDASAQRVRPGDQGEHLGDDPGIRLQNPSGPDSRSRCFWAPGSSAFDGGKMAGSHGDHQASNRAGTSACTFGERRSRSDDPGTISRHETSTASDGPDRALVHARQ